MEQKRLPIGVFDSGIGGLSVLHEALKILPNEDFLYYGDDANAPYGTKTEDEIRELTLRCGAFLYEKGIKAMVMACNTATSVAVLEMRRKYQIPVVSMEPAVKPAVAHLKDGYALVLATPATVSRKRYLDLLNRVGNTQRVLSVGCHGLVEAIEEGDFDHPRIDEILLKLLKKYEGYPVDAIVLGCTHYAFIQHKIHAYAQKHFTGERAFFNGAEGTVRQLKNVLAARRCLNDAEHQRSVRFYSSSGTGEIALYQRILKELGDETYVVE